MLVYFESIARLNCGCSRDARQRGGTSGYGHRDGWRDGAELGVPKEVNTTAYYYAVIAQADGDIIGSYLRIVAMAYLPEITGILGPKSYRSQLDIMLLNKLLGSMLIVGRGIGIY